MKKVGLYRRHQAPGEEEREPLTIHNMATPEGINVLGSIAAVALFRHRFLALHLDSDGVVRVVQNEAIGVDWNLNDQLTEQRAARVEHALQQQTGDIESRLDLMPEEQAIGYLSDAGWDDTQIGSYLERRDLRLSGGGNGVSQPQYVAPAAPPAPQTPIPGPSPAVPGHSAPIPAGVPVQEAPAPPGMPIPPAVPGYGQTVHQAVQGQLEREQHVQEVASRASPTTPSVGSYGTPTTVEQVPQDPPGDLVGFLSSQGGLGSPPQPRPAPPAPELQPAYGNGDVQTVQLPTNISQDNEFGGPPEDAAPAPDFGLLRPGMGPDED